MKSRILLIAVALAALTQPMRGQTKVWSLQDCLDYAVENNIQVRLNRNTVLSSQEDVVTAKSAMLPSVSAGVSQGFTNAPVAGTNNYNGSYNLSADMTLYNGGKLRNSLKQSQLQNRVDSLSLEESIRDIRISIIQAYMNCLYTKESIVVNESTVEASRAQMERAEQLWHSGYLSKVDYAQLQSQYQSDCYQLVVARNSYETGKLTLKQLLELDVLDEIELDDVNIEEDRILALIPGKQEVFENAKATMPELLRSQANIDIADLQLKSAKAGVLPSLSLSAGLGTSNGSFSDDSFSSQLQNNLQDNVGVSLKVPIFSQNQNKSAVRKAIIAQDNAKLNYMSQEKAILKEVESAYLDVLASQSQYVAAKQKEASAEQSYELTYEQFSVGTKNTVELITAQNELTSARQQLILSKYTALENIELLNIYQGK